MRYCICLLALSGFVFLTSCTDKKYSYNEAQRSLKVLNSDFANFFTAVSENDEWKALNFLWEQPSAPLPFQKEKFKAGHPYADYNFSDSKGLYRWDSPGQNFLKVEPSDQLVLLFPLVSGGSDWHFELSDFESQPISSRPAFPTRILASLAAGGSEKLLVTHSATVADGLPQTIKSKVEGGSYLLTGSFVRTRENDKGSLKVEVEFKEKGFRIISGEINATIGYSKAGYFFDEIRFTCKAFNHVFRGEIDYGQIEPTSSDYAGSFNRHSRIKIIENPGNHVVGEIILGKTGNGELLDYFVRFAGGKEELLSDYLPFLNKMLNFKY